MITCKVCGGVFHAHGHFIGKITGEITERYQCYGCKRTVSVRGGKVVGGIRKIDWRMAGNGPDGDAEGGIHGREVPSTGNLDIHALERAIGVGKV